MKFRAALALAAGVHVLLMLLLWRGWPEGPAPAGEVVPLELRAAEPPTPPPAEPPPPVAAPASAGGGKSAKHAPRMVVNLQPEPGGDVPAAPESPSEGGGSTGGGGSGSAPSGNGSAPTGPPAAAAPVVVDHGPLRAQAMERIRQQRRYPELARRRRLEGTVVVVFRVAADGGVSGLRVKKSVDEMLDQAALEAVRSAAPLPGALASDGELEVLLQFSLRP